MHCLIFHISGQGPSLGAGGHRSRHRAASVWCAALCLRPPLRRSASIPTGDARFMRCRRTFTVSSVSSGAGWYRRGRRVAFDIAKGAVGCRPDGVAGRENGPLWVTLGGMHSMWCGLRLTFLTSLGLCLCSPQLPAHPRDCSHGQWVPAGGEEGEVGCGDIHVFTQSLPPLPPLRLHSLACRTSRAPTVRALCLMQSCGARLQVHNASAGPQARRLTSPPPAAVLLTASGTAKLADVAFSRALDHTFLSDLPLIGTFAW